jgi:cation transport ATPase
MESAKKASDNCSSVQPTTDNQVQQFKREGFKEILPKKLKSGLLVAIGYLLSPLCWWNDLIINLPIAYFFGYICSWFSPQLLIPCSFLGYWISNIAGILLMQIGAVNMLQRTPQERNLKKDLLMGIASSTAYSIAILALIQFKIINIPVLFSLAISN